MGFTVPAVRYEMNHRQQAVADFYKMAEKLFAEVNESQKERIINSAIPKNTQKATQFGLSVFNGPNICVRVARFFKN